MKVGEIWKYVGNEELPFYHYEFGDEVKIIEISFENSDYMIYFIIFKNNQKGQHTRKYFLENFEKAY